MPNPNGKRIRTRKLSPRRLVKELREIRLSLKKVVLPHLKSRPRPPARILTQTSSREVTSRRHLLLSQNLEEEIAQQETWTTALPSRDRTSQEAVVRKSPRELEDQHSPEDLLVPRIRSLTPGSLEATSPRRQLMLSHQRGLRESQPLNHQEAVPVSDSETLTPPEVSQQPRNEIVYLL